MTHRAIRRHQKRRDKDQALEKAYAEVDARDAFYCRVTGRYTQAGAVDPRVRREHHHLSGRNVAPEDRANPRRIITTCAEVHQLLHAGLLIYEGDDANERLIFTWSERVHPNDRPFHIKSKRWSQNEDGVGE
jgi:hypothetical protein